LSKDYEQAREAEDKLRDQLKEKIDLVKILEEAATQTANSINLLTSKIEELNLQIEELKIETKHSLEIIKRGTPKSSESNRKRFK
jgi:hypothetical protein